MGLISSFCTFIHSDVFNQSTLDLRFSGNAQVAQLRHWPGIRRQSNKCAGSNGEPWQRIDG